MPDIMNLSVTQLAAANVTVPRFQISCQVVDSQNQASVIANLTGGNAIQFPSVLATLSAADRQQLTDLIAHFLVRKVAGV